MNVRSISSSSSSTSPFCFHSISATKGDFKFISATYRLFKVPGGARTPRQVVYDGNITGGEDSFIFDSQYTFKANDVMEVDGELAEILSRSRIEVPPLLWCFICCGGRAHPALVHCCSGIGRRRRLSRDIKGGTSSHIAPELRGRQAVRQTVGGRQAGRQGRQAGQADQYLTRVAEPSGSRCTSHGNHRRR
ncbi:hypothetical protein CRUP_003043 [Coryphaenoides rupestris]|nr:hypothetical protein CRUP_003043 [Coryphaenoides rupestris]